MENSKATINVSMENVYESLYTVVLLMPLMDDTLSCVDYSEYDQP